MILKKIKFQNQLNGLAIFLCLTLSVEVISFFSNQSLTIINYAQAEEEKKKKKKLTKAEKEARLKYKDKVTQRRKSVGPACAKRLTKVMEYTELEDWINAEKLLTDSLKSTTNRGCRPGFEHSQINRYLGYVYYAQDKIELAIEAYMSVVNEPEADPQQRIDTRYTAAQLLFVTERYLAAVEQLEIWQNEAAIVDPGGRVLLARGYYQLDRKKEALILLEDVMSNALSAGVIPKESWLNFQWALYYEKDDYKSTIPVSHLLLTHYTKIKYWKQLSAMYGALEKSEQERLALEITYLEGGLDKEKQFIALAYQYLAIDIPYRAAKVIDKAMQDGFVERTEKNLSLLGSSYQRAQEYRKASPVLEEAAKKSEDGNAWSRLSGVYLNLNENEKALVAARNALKKGDLKREDLAWMSRGTAEQALHCYEDATKSFNKAVKFEKVEKSAKSWRAYVKNEGERRRKLIANGADLATCKKV
jgi:tetratricopeptide (TPR) repeat protein